ncbi:MAG: sulfatase-like hydrolase/transferase [Bacteriovoracaceae bacterium]|nr:sulfatase-like hydrolase/transferase [Bacteriovoracaceae bacterium]
MNTRLTTKIFVFIAIFNITAVFAGTGKQRVVLISVDGLSAVTAQNALTATLSEAEENGRYIINAKTVLPARTIPAHTSMLTGLKPAVHQMIDNSAHGESEIQDTTIFDYLNAAGKYTAAVVAKQKLKNILSIDGPETIDKLYYPEKVQPLSLGMSVFSYDHQRKIIPRALEIIEENQFDFLFVHFADVDWKGHQFNFAARWNQRVQTKTVRKIDKKISAIIAKLKETDPELERTTIVVTSDHGGHGLDHGVEDTEGQKVDWEANFQSLTYDMFMPIDYTIPWISIGNKSRTLSIYGQSEVFVDDTYRMIQEIFTQK